MGSGAYSPRHYALEPLALQKKDVEWMMLANGLALGGQAGQRHTSGRLRVAR
jgi:hypothetical protein